MPNNIKENDKCIDTTASMNRQDIVARLRESLKREENLKNLLNEAIEALKPFADIKPSTFYLADGSEKEGYEVILTRDWNHGDGTHFTGTDLARARNIVAKSGERKEPSTAHTPPTRGSGVLR
jgi:hypothetical protein